MALPPWTIELLRRGLSDVARRASEPETLEKLKTQATEILQDLPQTAARGIDAVMRSAEAGKKTVQRWWDAARPNYFHSFHNSKKELVPRFPSSY